MDKEMTTTMPDIQVANDCGRKKVTILVESGGDTTATLETGSWSYSDVLSALIRSKYSADDVEALVQNKMNGTIDADTEYDTLTEWRTKCKERAAYLMNLGKSDYGLTNKEWQERCIATLEKARKETLAAIADYDDSEEVNAFYFNGQKITWSSKDSSSLRKDVRMGLRQNISDKITLGEETITMWLGEMSITLPPKTADALMCKIEDYAYECFNVTAFHKQAVQKLTTIEELEAYNYRDGYPSKLEFTV